MPDAKSKGRPGNVNLETHPLVAKLHADPDELTDLVALVGYLGPSKREGYVRLYVDLTFHNYYEIPAEGIVSTSPTDASDENSPTAVHVAGGTQVDKVSVTSQSTEARFLQGSISSGYLGSADAGAGALGWPGSPTCWCTSHTCLQGAAQAAQPYTDTVYASCACSYGQATCNNCGQAGAAEQFYPTPSCPIYCNPTQYRCAQANAQAWPPSPTCWGCHTTVPCGRGVAQQVQTGYTNTVGYTCVCSYVNTCGQADARGAPQYLSYVCSYVHCGQGGAGDVGCSWPASPTCWCGHTSQGCT